MKTVAMGFLLLSLWAYPIIAGGGAVSLQTADPSCADNSGNIYVDCGNGTVTDNRTGLIWLKRASCLFDTSNWITAMGFAAGLSDHMPNPHDCRLSDNSSPGEWRLPSAAEWEAMMVDATALGCIPTITNDAGTACWDESCSEGAGCSFQGVQDYYYWTATTSVEDPVGSAWFADVDLGGFVDTEVKSMKLYVWPVRGGQ